MQRLFNWQVSRFVGKFGRVEKMLEYLERKPAMVLDGPLYPDELRGSLEFKDVNFSYPSRPESAVLNVRNTVEFAFNALLLHLHFGMNETGLQQCYSL